MSLSSCCPIWCRYSPRRTADVPPIPSTSLDLAQTAPVTDALLLRCRRRSPSSDSSLLRLASHHQRPEVHLVASIMSVPSCVLYCVQLPTAVQPADRPPRQTTNCPRHMRRDTAPASAQGRTQGRRHAGRSWRCSGALRSQVGDGTNHNSLQ